MQETAFSSQSILGPKRVPFRADGRSLTFIVYERPEVLGTSRPQNHLSCKQSAVPLKGGLVRQGRRSLSKTTHLEEFCCGLISKTVFGMGKFIWKSAGSCEERKWGVV